MLFFWVLKYVVMVGVGSPVVVWWLSVLWWLSVVSSPVSDGAPLWTRVFSPRGILRVWTHVIYTCMFVAIVC